MVEQLTFSVKGRQYQTKPVKVGSVIDIWKLRSTISMGTYGGIYRMALENADESLTMVDIECFMMVFCPQFIEDLKPGSVQEMGLEDYLEVREIYVKTIKPWLDSIESLLKSKSGM